MKNKGFTLIELIVVIVVLGILAVTAAPKFMDIQGDAKKATLSGVNGALKGAEGITFGKAALAGLDKGAGKIEVNGEEIIVIYGVPVASKDNLDKIMDTDINVFDGTTNAQKNPYVVFGFQDTVKAITDSKCYLEARNVQKNNTVIFETEIIAEGC
ncbi:type II secretion system protein [Photobacterium sanguinicancri]|uniref:type II secretion system protein n=1 Tax=Photobacterium sanguinicancri TaxID=875932 RepID=UPI003D0BDF56